MCLFFAVSELKQCHIYVIFKDSKYSQFRDDRNTAIFQELYISLGQYIY